MRLTHSILQAGDRPESKPTFIDNIPGGAVPFEMPRHFLNVVLHDRDQGRVIEFAVLDYSIVNAESKMPVIVWEGKIIYPKKEV